MKAEDGGSYDHRVEMTVEKEREHETYLYTSWTTTIESQPGQMTPCRTELLELKSCRAQVVDARAVLGEQAVCLDSFPAGSRIAIQVGRRYGLCNTINGRCHGRSMAMTVMNDVE